MFTIETQVEGSEVRRDFNEHAQVEIVDCYGHTLAAFRDLYGWGWNFLVNERPDYSCTLYAYGRRLGRWSDLAPKGMHELDRLIRRAWEDHEGYPHADERAEVDPETCAHKFVVRDDDPEIAYCEICGVDDNAA